MSNGNIRGREALVRAIGCAFERICFKDEPFPNDVTRLTIFHSQSIPNFSISDFLHNITSNTVLSEEAIVQASIHVYILAMNGKMEMHHLAVCGAGDSKDEKETHNDTVKPSNQCLQSLPQDPFFELLQTWPVEVQKYVVIRQFTHPRASKFSTSAFTVSAFNIYRLLLTSLLMTAKFVDDAFYNNSCYAKMAAITLQEMNRQEVELFQMLQHELFMDPMIFTLFYRDIFCNPRMHDHELCRQDLSRHLDLPQLPILDEELSTSNDLNVNSHSNFEEMMMQQAGNDEIDIGKSSSSALVESEEKVPTPFVKSEEKGVYHFAKDIFSSFKSGINEEKQMDSETPCIVDGDGDVCMELLEATKSIG